MEWCTRRPSRLAPGLVRQRVVGRPHVRELGVGRDRRQHEGGEHRVTAARLLKRRVGVPEAVREAVQALPVLRVHDLAARTDVRDVGERFVAEAALLQDADAGLAVELAVEPGGEVTLLIAGERLVPEHEHCVLVHAGANPLQGLVVVHLAQVDRARLGGEERVELAELERHRVSPACGPVSMGRSGSCAHSPMEPS